MLLTIIFLFGIVIGSFLSALSYRYPKDVSVIKGRSFCDSCGKAISWYDNIPLISYLVLAGKCRNCKKHISLRYPAIELVTGVGFSLIYLYQNLLPYNFFFLIFIFCLLILIFIVDVEHQIIPDVFIFFGIFVTVSYFIFIHFDPLFVNLFTGFAAALFLLSLNIVTRGRGMGLGDVKFALLGGFLMGKFTFIWLLLAFLTGGVAGFILILGRKVGLKDRIAFGPFLVFALILTEVFGSLVLEFLNC